mmetsp:Transcript_15977/g.24082  ORF Transcript_15977/g.24082 Transcript_15977/m.24082 type:complete len:89 (+) Transcript_15977:1789-2055(+)
MERFQLKMLSKKLNRLWGLLKTKRRNHRGVRYCNPDLYSVVTTNYLGCETLHNAYGCTYSVSIRIQLCNQTAIVDIRTSRIVAYGSVY